MKHITLIALTAATSLGFSLFQAHADLLFSESFEYPAGTLNGDGPPPDSPPGQSGWTTDRGSTQIRANGLSFFHVFSAGGAANFIDTGSNGDSSYASISPVNSSIVWIGYMIRQKSGGSFGYATLNLLPPDGSPPPGFGLLFAHGLYGIDNDTGAQHSQAVTTVAPSLDPAWLVIRLNFNTGEEELFVNPSGGGSEPINADGEARLLMTPEFQAAGFDRVLLHVGYNSGGFQMDELRVGTTFADIRTGN